MATMTAETKIEMHYYPRDVTNGMAHDDPEDLEGVHLPESKAPTYGEKQYEGEGWG